MWTNDNTIQVKSGGRGQSLCAEELKGRTPGGIPVIVRFGPPPQGEPTLDANGLRLRLEHARLSLLRGFEELLCLDGVRGVEHLPHQIETVRRVLRHFRGRVMLADEVGLGKTIEACLLLREYLLRGLVRRVLILTPPALVSQWQEELTSKFDLQFAVATSGTASSNPQWWSRHERVLASLSLAKSRNNFDAVAGQTWDLVIVDEAHHCKNRATRNWQLINALRRRYLFLLTATPVQNDLVELYNLLTLLEPGHLKTERDFKKTYVRRGNPRDPRNRERLRSLLLEVMIRNTRSLVSIDLPARYAQTFVVEPCEDEAKLYHLLETYLRWRYQPLAPMKPVESDEEPDAATEAMPDADQPEPEPADEMEKANDLLPPLTRMQVNVLLLATGSHPAALVPMLERMAGQDARAQALLERARRIGLSAKEKKLLELLRRNRDDKTLVFANFRMTLARLALVLTQEGIAFSVFSGDKTAAQKDKAVEDFRTRMPVMLCSESGGEGRNLQFANTLINFDLPWNPMRIEQRVGRIHRIGQTREVFIFNLCTAGSLEERLLRLLNDKIRMFELIVGEVGSILGNLEGGEEFESLILNLWLRSKNAAELDTAFEQLGESLLGAHEQYLKTKELDEALFGDDYE
ncbi:MAG: DEAD/DEAH box helicase family protein [Planctomycetes bacterium]|nr:DEAD/DEAH box helicase family protein [Planctomycetota bacterium]